jgi:hypothetical protein
MRRPAYVDDATEVLRWPPLPPRRASGAGRDSRGDTD